MLVDGQQLWGEPGRPALGVEKLAMLAMVNSYGVNLAVRHWGWKSSQCWSMVKSYGVNLAVRYWGCKSSRCWSMVISYGVNLAVRQHLRTDSYWTLFLTAAS
jgi:hypothetical protein